MVKQERIVSISALTKGVLKKWRWMLLTAVVFALIAAGYRAFKLYPRMSVSQETTQAEENAQQEAQAIPLNSELEKVERSLTEKNQQFDNSFLSKINVNEAPKATATIMVTTKEMEEEDALLTTYDSNGGIVQLVDAATRDANRILTYYLRSAEFNTDWGSLLEEYQTEPQYLNELINIRNFYKDLVSADIVVFFPDEAGAMKLLNCILKQLENRYEEVASVLGEHKLQVICKYSSTNSADKTYFNWMNDRIGEINNLCTQRDNLKNNMRLVRTSSSSETLALSLRDVIMSAVKFGIIGFIGGLVLFIIICAIVLILSNVVLSARELNRQYGFNKLAVVPSDTNIRKGLDAVPNRIDKDYYSSHDIPTAYKIALENICNASGKGAKIALFGDLSAGSFEQSRLALNNNNNGGSIIEFCTLADLNKNPAALSELETCDSAVLVVKTGVSKYNSINDLLGTVEAYNKKVLGSLVID